MGFHQYFDSLPFHFALERLHNVFDYDLYGEANFISSPFCIFQSEFDGSQSLFVANIELNV